MLDRFTLALTGAFFASILGNPLDLALVRLQSENFLPADKKRNYKHVIDVIIRIPKEEGIAVLWRGFPTFSLRVIALTTSQLTTFDQFKIIVNKIRGQTEVDFLTRLFSVGLTGIVASAAALPFDNIKMKLMKMSPDQNGVFPYKGVIDCGMKSIQREGILGLWVGYLGFWSLVAPHTMVTLMTMDYLHYYFGSQLMQNKK